MNWETMSGTVKMSRMRLEIRRAFLLSKRASRKSGTVIRSSFLERRITFPESRRQQR